MAGRTAMEESLRRSLGSYRPSPAGQPAARPDAVPGAEAAVSVVLAGDDLSLLLIVRAHHPDDPWSGHVALPGGRRDASDVDLLGTARRETEEEVGFALSEDSLWGTLPSVEAGAARKLPTRLSVTPFVFRLPERPVVRPNHEVAEVIWIPLLELVSRDRRASMDVEHEGQRFSFPAYRVGQHFVWGLTHRVLRTLTAPAAP